MVSGVYEYINKLLGGRGNIIKKPKTVCFQGKYFNLLFIVGNAKLEIKIEILAKLRFLRHTIYSIAPLGNLQDKDLVILFA